MILVFPLNPRVETLFVMSMFFMFYVQLALN